MKAACKELEEKISATVKLPDQLDAADFRHADLGHEDILVPVMQKFATGLRIETETGDAAK